MIKSLVGTLAAVFLAATPVLAQTPAPAQTQTQTQTQRPALGGTSASAEPAAVDDALFAAAAADSGAAEVALSEARQPEGDRLRVSSGSATK